MKGNNIRATQVRFPANIYSELKKRAMAARRSFNAEVIVSIEQCLAIKDAGRKTERK